MKFKDLLKWNTRVSALYAAGVWGMIGSYAYFRYMGRYENILEKKEEEVEENPNQVVYETAHSKTIIIYKKDFVPYSTRIYNFLKSFTGESGDE